MDVATEFDLINRLRARRDDTITRLLEAGAVPSASAKDMFTGTTAEIDELESTYQEMLRVKKINNLLASQLEAAEARIANLQIISDFLRTDGASRVPSPPVGVGPEVVAPTPATATDPPATGKKSVRLVLPEDEEKEKKPEERHFLFPLEQAEFGTVPKYQRGRLELKDLNAIVSTLDSFLLRKERLIRLAKQRKKLSPTDFTQVSKWLEQEDGLKIEELGCMEAELRSLLPDKLKGALKSTLLSLRHLKKIREVRKPGVVFIIPNPDL